LSACAAIDPVFLKFPLEFVGFDISVWGMGFHVDTLQTKAFNKITSVIPR